MKEIFAKRLRELRKARGLKQSQVASAIGISMYTVSVWERGMRIPEQRLLMKLADFFHVPDRYFFSESVQEPEQLEKVAAPALAGYQGMYQQRLLNLDDIVGEYVVTISIRKKESIGKEESSSRKEITSKKESEDKTL